MGWILKQWKQKFEEGKEKGLELREKHWGKKKKPPT